jgi:hypothetical protein
VTFSLQNTTPSAVPVIAYTLPLKNYTLLKGKGCAKKDWRSNLLKINPFLGDAKNVRNLAFVTFGNMTCNGNEVSLLGEGK